MDSLNRFHTRATYALVRSDYISIGMFLAFLLIGKFHEIDWLAFVLAFWWIDVLGYIPGALWYRFRSRAGERPMPRAFFTLYNVAHNVSLNLAIIVAWYVLRGRFEIAMLAAPLHLCIDRGVFGNIYKTTSLSFEPIADREFAAFSLALERKSAWTTSPDPAEVESSAISSIVRDFSDHPSIGLVFNKETSYFKVPDLSAFIAYRRRGRTMFCLGGPVGAPQTREPLLREFLAFAKQHRCRAIALQVRESDVELFHKYGFRVNQMGSSYTLQLADFSLAGGRFMKLRNKIKQPLKAGITVRELTASGESPEALARRLDQVSAAWLQAKGTHIKELRFLVGEMESLQREGTRCFGALRGDDVIAFITYVPSYGRFAGYMHDLTRRTPDCPPGTLEAINIQAIETFKAEGVAHLCFGFTPLVGIDDKHPSHSRMIAKLFRVMAEKAAFIYPAASQEAYKRKWHPQFVEPEYMVFQGPFALRQLWSFLRLTRSI